MLDRCQMGAGGAGCCSILLALASDTVRPAPTKLNFERTSIDPPSLNLHELIFVMVAQPSGG